MLFFYLNVDNFLDQFLLDDLLIGIAKKMHSKSMMKIAQMRYKCLALTFQPFVKFFKINKLI